MKASQVTKVSSTPAHPRGNGLVERQNRTLLTLLRVHTSRKMQDWDEHINGVLGAYNSTRDATTGFSPYMLQNGAEKSIPVSFIYPEFAARGFESKEEFVEHLLARQQEIHGLVRRNTHQAQLRQKVTFEPKSKSARLGDAVWVFCHIIAKGGTRKLIRAWRGPHKVTDVLKDGRLYVLDTCQKVHYGRLKKHVPALWDWATHQPFGPDQNVVIITDPYVEEIASDSSRDSLLPEQLPEASFEIEPTRPVPPRTMQTRTQTGLEQGVPRRRFSQFGYPSESESEPEVTEPLLLDSAPQIVFPELDDLDPLFSDQEEIQPATLTESLIPSSSGTSATLLSNPSLTDNLSNFPLFNPQSRDPSEPEPLAPTTQPQEVNIDDESQIANQSLPPTNTSRRGWPRGRPPGHRIQRTTSSSRTTTSSRKPTTRPRTRAPPRTHDRAMTLPEILEGPLPTQSDSHDDAPTRAPRYQLRANRAPRYRCGTCGSCNCSCVQLITTEHPNLRLARGAAIPARELTLVRTPEQSQYQILTMRSQPEEFKTRPTIRHIILTVDKTYTSTESGLVPPLETTLKSMHDFSPSDCPTYRFKEWTRHDHGGLESTLAATIPPLPPSFTFGEFDRTCDNVQMIRWITAHQLWDKYHNVSLPGDVYQPTKGWWLLITSLDDTSLVSPNTLLMCLKNLRAP